MIVSCPACATRFSLDASMLGPNGRNVRCAKCAHRWRQEPPAPIEPLPPVVLDAPAESQMAPGLAALLSGREQQKPAAQVVVPPKLRPAPPKRKVGVWPWILLLGILCGLAVAAYIYQGPIARMFPAAQDIYSLFGIGGSDPARVLQIGNLKSEQRSGFLSVRGDVFNPSDYPLKIPPLMLIAQDENGAPLGNAFMFRTQESTVAPGETITFRIPFESPPKGMKGFSVTFGRVNAAK